MSAKTGPKAQASLEPLCLTNRQKASKKFQDFCRQYVVIRDDRKGRLLKPLKIEQFQRDFYGKIYDARPQPRLAALILPRGNGKSTLCAAIALFELFCGNFNANICLVATDERQAGIIYEIARFMVLNSPELAKRAHIFKDRITVPGTQSTLRVLPAAPDSLEGLDFSLAILDEAGVANPDTYSVLVDSQGKRASSTLLLIGTPGVSPESPLATVRKHCRDNPSDPLSVLVEYSADDFQSHSADCSHCWELANPLLDHGLSRDGLTAALKTTPEARFRRVRLAQWCVGQGDTYLDRATFDACRDDNRVILPGSPVVISLDGSRSNDATVLIRTSIEPKPIVEVAGFWAPRENGEDVPILEVEERIREQREVYDVKEFTGDPYLWQRTFQIMEGEGMTVTQFPNSRERMSPALQAFRSGVIEREMSWNGDERLAQHVANAVIQEWARGFVISKRTKSSPDKIDACISAVMGYTRAKYYASQKPASKTLRVLKMKR